MSPKPSAAQAARVPPGRLYTYKTLAEKGVVYSRNHIRRLVEAGKFPQPFYLSERRPAWTEAALDEFIAKREAERDTDTDTKRRSR